MGWADERERWHDDGWRRSRSPARNQQWPDQSLALRSDGPKPPSNDVPRGGISNILSLNSEPPKPAAPPVGSNPQAMAMYKEFMEEEKRKEEDRIERRRKTSRQEKPTAPEVSIPGWERMSHREREDALVRSRKGNEERFMYVNRRGGGMPVQLPGHAWRPNSGSSSGSSSSASKKKKKKKKKAGAKYDGREIRGWGESKRDKKARLKDTTVIDPAELCDIDIGNNPAPSHLNEAAKEAAAAIFGQGGAPKPPAPGQPPPPPDEKKPEAKKPAAPTMEDLIRKGLEFAKNRADTPQQQASLAEMLGSTK